MKHMNAELTEAGGGTADAQVAGDSDRMNWTGGSPGKLPGDYVTWVFWPSQLPS